MAQLCYALSGPFLEITVTLLALLIGVLHFILGTLDVCGTDVVGELRSYICESFFPTRAPFLLKNLYDILRPWLHSQFLGIWLPTSLGFLLLRLLSRVYVPACFGAAQLLTTAARGAPLLIALTKADSVNSMKPLVFFRILGVGDTLLALSQADRNLALEFLLTLFSFAALYRLATWHRHQWGPLLLQRAALFLLTNGPHILSKFQAAAGRRRQHSSHAHPTMPPQPQAQAEPRPLPQIQPEPQPEPKHIQPAPPKRGENPSRPVEASAASAAATASPRVGPDAAVEALSPAHAAPLPAVAQGGASVGEKPSAASPFTTAGVTVTSMHAEGVTSGCQVCGSHSVRHRAMSSKTSPSPPLSGNDLSSSRGNSSPFGSALKSGKDGRCGGLCGSGGGAVGVSSSALESVHAVASGLPQGRYAGAGGVTGADAQRTGGTEAAKDELPVGAASSAGSVGSGGIGDGASGSDAKAAASPVEVYQSIRTLPPYTSPITRRTTRIKIPFAEPEQLVPDYVHRLKRLAAEKGLHLTGVYVRAGCIELVLDTEHLAHGIAGGGGHVDDGTDRDPWDVRGLFDALGLAPPAADGEAAPVVTCTRLGGAAVAAAAGAVAAATAASAGDLPKALSLHPRVLQLPASPHPAAPVAYDGGAPLARLDLTVSYPDGDAADAWGPPLVLVRTNGVYLQARVLQCGSADDGDAAAGGVARNGISATASHAVRHTVALAYSVELLELPHEDAVLLAECRWGNSLVPAAPVLITRDTAVAAELAAAAGIALAADNTTAGTASTTDRNSPTPEGYLEDLLLDLASWWQQVAVLTTNGTADAVQYDCTPVDVVQALGRHLLDYATACGWAAVATRVRADAERIAAVTTTATTTTTTAAAASVTTTGCTGAAAAALNALPGGTSAVHDPTVVAAASGLPWASLSSSAITYTASAASASDPEPTATKPTAAAHIMASATAPKSADPKGATKAAQPSTAPNGHTVQPGDATAAAGEADTPCHGAADSSAHLPIWWPAAAFPMRRHSPPPSRRIGSGRLLRSLALAAGWTCAPPKEEADYQAFAAPLVFAYGHVIQAVEVMSLVVLLFRARHQLLDAGNLTSLAGCAVGTLTALAWPLLPHAQWVALVNGAKIPRYLAYMTAKVMIGLLGFPAPPGIVPFQLGPAMLIMEGVLLPGSCLLHPRTALLMALIKWPCAVGMMVKSGAATGLAHAVAATGRIVLCAVATTVACHTYLRAKYARWAAAVAAAEAAPAAAAAIGHGAWAGDGDATPSETPAAPIGAKGLSALKPFEGLQRASPAAATGEAAGAGSGVETQASAWPAALLRFRGGGRASRPQLA